LKVSNKARSLFAGLRDLRHRHDASFWQSSRRILAVMLRYPTPVTVLGMLLALGLGTPSIVAAASTTSGTSTQPVQWTSSPLVASTDLSPADPTSKVPQVIIDVSPAGAVVPPTLDNGSLGSPLTVPKDSKGFDPAQLVVALLNTKDVGGNSVQEIGLDFFGPGVKAGTSFPLTLSINPAMADKPPTLKALTPGFQFLPNPPPSAPSAATSAATSTSSNSSGSGRSINPSESSSNNAGSGAVTIPEPLSLALWSAIVVGLVTRKRLSTRVQPV
jgi:hypothetical protein